MNKKNLKMKNLNWIIVLAMLLSCTATNNINKPTNQSPVVSSTPSKSATIIPSQSPSVPVQTPSTIVTAPGSPPSVTAVPTQLPTQVTTDISEMATLNGKVYDESANPLSDIKVSIKSLDENFKLTEETTTSNGSYVFRNIPVGVRLQVDVFKSDTWTKKSQSIVLKSNLSGATDFNVLDFGDIYNIDDPKKTNFYFITDAPEVTSVTPNRNSKVIHYGISVKMVFSEPVKKEIVEKNFIMRYIKSDISANTAPGDGTQGTENTDGPPAVLRNNQVIIAKNTVASSFTWDNNNVGEFGREATFAVNENIGIPTSNKNRVLYSISLREKAGDVRIQDAEGHIGLSFGEFFIDGRRAKNVVIPIEADKTQPYIDTLKLLKTTGNCIIRLTFSEPMVVQYVDNPDLTDPSFYAFYKNGSPITLVAPVFKLADPETLEIYTSTSTFQTNDLIKVAIDPNLKDPAGNFLATGVTSGLRDNVRQEKYIP